MICFAGNSNSSIVLTLTLSVVTPNLSLNPYARASILVVRFSEPVVIVAAVSRPEELEEQLPSLTLTFGFTGTSLTLFR